MEQALNDKNMFPLEVNRHLSEQVEVRYKNILMIIDINNYLISCTVNF